MLDPESRMTRLEHDVVRLRELLLRACGNLAASKDAATRRCGEQICGELRGDLHRANRSR